MPPEADGDFAGVVAAVAMGSEGTLEPDEVAFFAGSVTGRVRNVGSKRGEAPLFLIGPPEGTMAEATPAP